MRHFVEEVHRVRVPIKMQGMRIVSDRCSTQQPQRSPLALVLLLELNVAFEHVIALDLVYHRLLRSVCGVVI